MAPYKARNCDKVNFQDIVPKANPSPQGSHQDSTVSFYDSQDEHP
jgi:hypothetical protein